MIFYLTFPTILNLSIGTSSICKKFCIIIPPYYLISMKEFLVLLEVKEYINSRTCYPQKWSGGILFCLPRRSKTLPLLWPPPPKFPHRWCHSFPQSQDLDSKSPFLMSIQGSQCKIDVLDLCISKYGLRTSSIAQEFLRNIGSQTLFQIYKSESLLNKTRQSRCALKFEKQPAYETFV